jgi:DeoR family transcriptional regulator, aga operon transcriptional repressor
MNNRQQTLIDRLNNTGHLSVVEQANELGVTEMTIRRDLQLFEKGGIATRVHGGAVPRSPIPHGIDIMAQKPRESQVAIAKQAVKLLKPGSTVLFNVGTTVLQVAREIATVKIPLTVITNSIPVAVALYKSECQVILPGGTLRRQGLDLTGPITEKNLDEYHVDVLISGCDGADSKVGFFTNDINLTPIEKKSVKIADRAVIVTESSKFLGRSFEQFATMDDISVLVTDKGLPASDITNIENRGPELFLV